MEARYPREELFELTVRQLDTMFMLSANEKAVLDDVYDPALARLGACFAHIRRSDFRKNGTPRFNPYHTAQYCMFLYVLSRCAYVEARNEPLAEKLYFLNKMLNSVDLFYQVELPKVFFVDHTLGTVLGRATYGEFFSFRQHNTVGNNYGRYPVFGENVKLFAGAAVVGASHVGSNCWISAGTYVKDQDIPDNSIVFGASPNLIVKTKPADFFWEHSNFTKLPQESL